MLKCISRRLFQTSYASQALFIDFSLVFGTGGNPVSQHYIIKCMYVAYDVFNVIYSDFIAYVSTKNTEIRNNCELVSCLKVWPKLIVIVFAI